MSNTKDNIFNNFTGIYPINKTLRFELRPVGKTYDLIKDFKNGYVESIVAIDEKRSEARKRIIEIIDEYYEEFINTVLSKKVFYSDDIWQTYTSYKAYKSDKRNKEFVTQKAIMRKKISDAFQNEKTKFNLKDFKDLFGKKSNLKESPLYKWYKNKLDIGEITGEDFEDIIKIITYFIGFTTSLKDYQENRNNLFVAEEQSTAISHRIIDVNMIRYFENCIRFENMKDSELLEDMGKWEKYFVPANYDNFFTQEGIDNYNEIIGRKSKDLYYKGVNQLINEYRQKNKIKNKDMPTMNQLYKQHISKNGDNEINNDFSNEKEMLEQIEQAYITSLDKINRIVSFINENITEGNKIFIRKDFVTNISNRLFGEWNFINNALYSYLSGLSAKNKELFVKQTEEVIKISELQNIIDLYINNLDEDEKEKYLKTDAIYTHFCSFDVCGVQNAYYEAKTVLAVDEINKDREKEEEGAKQISKVKKLLDEILEAVHFYKPLYLYKNGKEIDEIEKDEIFYSEFDYLYSQLMLVTELYDRVRNYLTKKPYSKDKFKIYFNKPTLLDGWDLNKEKNNLSVLLIKDGFYYLGIMDSKYNSVFDVSADDVKINTTELSEEATFLKMEYKQVSGASKMFPKVFFAASNKDMFKPSEEILNIRENKQYLKGANNREAVIKWIDFCKDCLKIHPEWNRYFNFNFRHSDEYENVNSFYEDADTQMYYINFVKFKETYINDLVEEGKLFLFQIYNKDFSEYSKGKPNLHTVYWKMLFDENNVRNINDNTGKPVFKLNGEAEIFYRKASLDKKVTHKKNYPIKNKNKHNNKTESIFEYDLYKDKRFMDDKFFFHCPITINYRAKNILSSEFNKKFNLHIKNSDNMNILGVDRGERHLLYYSLINIKGGIIKQGSLNTIYDSYEKDGINIPVITDYKSILKDREDERMDSRKNWGTIKNIKEMKEGYLSHVVHQVSKLLIDNNAILVLENLNSGFKRRRLKIEKQVYQNFEKSLINKLNYLVLKDADNKDVGHFLKGYQLTAPFEGFQRLNNQSGIIYYVWPSYTSKICPRTGFVSLLHINYENIEKSKEFFNKFDKISYNKDKDYFEFHLDYTRFGKNAGKNKWVICTYGKDRYFFNQKLKKYEYIDITEKIKELLSNNGIDFINENDMRKSIVENNSKNFFGSLLFYLKVVMQLRYTNSNDGCRNENDYILSPVADINGMFFDSRHACDNEPENADANGAYHIALKGLRMIQFIENGVITKQGNETTDWFKFAQNKL